MHTHTHTHVYKHIDVQIHTHMHIYTYIHVCTHTHIHIYTQTHTKCTYETHASMPGTTAWQRTCKEPLQTKETLHFSFVWCNQTTFFKKCFWYLLFLHHIIKQSNTQVTCDRVLVSFEHEASSFYTRHQNPYTVAT